MGKFKVGDRVIVRPYNGYEWKGIIFDDAVRDYNYEYYLVKSVLDTKFTTRVNSVKIRLDKEWYRNQKIASILCQSSIKEIRL